MVDLRKEFKKSPYSWFVAKSDEEEEDDEQSADIVSPRGMASPQRVKSSEGDEGPVIDSRRTPRVQGSLKHAEAKFNSEVEKRVEERLKQQEEAMRSQLIEQLKQQAVITDKEKLIAEIDPKQVVKHFSVGKG